MSDDRELEKVEHSLEAVVVLLQEVLAQLQTTNALLLDLIGEVRLLPT
jgi:predicted class III extradiol MEMO1 family dioxygenase